MRNIFIFVTIMSAYFDVIGNAQTVGTFIDSGFRETFIPRAFADFDGDGALDIWVSQPELPDGIALSVGDLGFQMSDQSVANYRASEVITADFDNDGDIDILTIASGGSSSSPAGSVHLLINDGNGIFEENVDSNFGIARSTMAAGDLNGDGFLDVWIAKKGGDEIWINNQDARFFPTGQKLASDEEAVQAIVFGDLDGDGDLDAWAARGQVTRVWFNNGNGLFTPSQQEFAVSSIVDLGDVDNDSDLDAIYTRRTRGGQQSLLLYLNTGDGTLLPSDKLVFPTILMGVGFIDANMDGNLDIWLGADSLLLNVGRGAFEVKSIAGLGSDASKVHIIDVDLDGDLDVWVTGIGSPYESRLWLNGEAPKVLSISLMDDSIIIRYTGILQSAETPLGPYLDIPNASNPYIQNNLDRAKFFRSR